MRALANHWIIPKLEKFTLENPNLSFEFVTGPEIVNLSRREADFALRLVKPEQKDLVVRKLGVFQLSVFGATGLFERLGFPKDRNEIRKFPFIGLYPYATSAVEEAFLKKLGDDLLYLIRTSAWSSVYYAIHAGLGVGVLPSFMPVSDKKLRNVPCFGETISAIWLVVHPDVQKVARVREVINFLSEEINREFTTS